ncbi:MAG TPA: hypothetical protein VG389_08425 [Myxococcota bacterium]|nr:hypothetical protein [Myxococcota bacterium]
MWLATPTGLMVSADGTGALAAAPGNAPGTVRCLVELEDGLYACADNYGDDYAIGRTADGTTWEPIFRFEDMDDLLDCPAGTPVHDICGPLWPTVQDTFVPPPAPPGSGGGPGCACSAAGTRGQRTGAAPALALLLLALTRRAARRRMPAHGACARRP